MTRADGHSAAPADGPSAREAVVVGAITLLAFALRAWHVSSAGLSQFDEGVYAFSGLGLSDPGQVHRLFPEQQKFSPPVYFSLVALSYLLGGATDRSAIMVNVVLGTLTVTAVWWVGRRWVGGAAAAGAACLLAVSEYHVTLSRTALTDVTFALVFLVALGALASALERGGTRRAVLAGLATGLAWNTKYHGWFALVIGAMAIAARWRLGGDDRRWFRGAARGWAIAAAVAACCYLPWALFIQTRSDSTGGWAAYFATMLRLDWLGNLAQYARQQAYLEGAWSRVGLPLAAMTTWAVRPAGGIVGRGSAMLLLTVGALVIGESGTALVLALLALPGVLGAGGRHRMSAWMLPALLGLWFIMAPVYQPYFRLLLPFTITTFLLAGRRLDSAPAGARPPASWWRELAVVGGAVAAVAAVGRVRQGEASPWRSARALANVAHAIAERLPAGAPVSVLGEPPLAFYLHQSGHAAFDRVTLADLDSARAPAYVITGVYARRAPALRAGMAERADRLQLMGRFPVDPTDLRLLDDRKVREARAYRARPDTSYDVLLYRYEPRLAAGGGTLRP